MREISWILSLHVNTVIFVHESECITFKGGGMVARDVKLECGLHGMGLVFPRQKPF